MNLILFPEGWSVHTNGTDFEFDNQHGVPMLLMEYKSSECVIISGLFSTPMGICKVDNNKETVYQLGDTLSQLGTYRVDEVFFTDRPFFNLVSNLFHSDRIYDLTKYY